MQPSFDKQFVRNWLTSPESGWDRGGDKPPPAAAARHRRRHPGALYRCLRTHFGSAVRRLDRLGRVTEALVPPQSETGRAPPRAPRRRLRRPLRVAARQVRSRGHRLPRGGERLHRAGDRPSGAVAAEDLRRDQGPHQGDRPVGADPPRRLVVLRPQLRGQAVRRALPLPDHRSRRLDAAEVRRAHRDPRRAGAARRERRGRGARLLRARRRHGQPRRQHLGLLGRRRRRRAIHVAVQGLAHRRAVRRRDRRHRRGRDLGRRQPHRLLHHGRRRVAAGHRVAAPLGAGLPAEKVYHEPDERFWLAVGPHPQRQVRDHRGGQRRDLGDPLRRRRRPRGRVRPRCGRAASSSSTRSSMPSSAARTASSSCTTTARRTSRSSRRR